MGIELSGDRTLDLKSQGGHSTTRPRFSAEAQQRLELLRRDASTVKGCRNCSHAHVCFFLSLIHLFHPLVSVLSQGLDPPHQSETRTVYVANRFPQHGHYIPQRFADNRIISSKVLSVCRDIISLS